MNTNYNRNLSRVFFVRFEKKTHMVTNSVLLFLAKHIPNFSFIFVTNVPIKQINRQTILAKTLPFLKKKKRLI